MKRTINTKFFHFSQNNSGGRFDHEPERGIGHHVIIEALNEQDAIIRAESIGLYFNGCDTGRDCDCCGDRWSQYLSEGTDIPTIYGENAVNFKTKNKWNIDNYIHYLDGTITRIKE